MCTVVDGCDTCEDFEHTQYEECKWKGSCWEEDYIYLDKKTKLIKPREVVLHVGTRPRSRNSNFWGFTDIVEDCQVGDWTNEHHQFSKVQFYTLSPRNCAKTPRTAPGLTGAQKVAF